MAAFSSDITSKKRDEAWKEVAEQVSAYGTATRTAEEVKEKWCGVKKEWRNRTSERRQTGGGSVETKPHDVIIEMIVGKDSELVEGVKGGGHDTFKEHVKGLPKIGTDCSGTGDPDKSSQHPLSQTVGYTAQYQLPSTSRQTESHGVYTYTVTGDNIVLVPPESTKEVEPLYIEEGMQSPTLKTTTAFGMDEDASTQDEAVVILPQPVRTSTPSYRSSGTQCLLDVQWKNKINTFVIWFNEKKKGVH